MKFSIFALALLPLALTACQSSHLPATSGDPAISTLSTTLKTPTQILPAYTWELDRGLQRPIVLSFDQRGRLSVASGCNGLGTSWTVKDNTLSTGDMMGTMMACDAPLMEQERFISQLLQKRNIPFSLDLNDANQPKLSITAADGQKYVFTGKMTPETKYQGQAETIFLEVSSQTKACTGVAQQTCLQVKEIKYDEKGLKTQVDKDWTLFYDQIEGFQHSSNERQIIRVKRYEIKNPAADQPKYAYVFDMTVEREAVKGTL